MLTYSFGTDTRRLPYCRTTTPDRIRIMFDTKVSIQKCRRSWKKARGRFESIRQTHWSTPPYYYGL